MHPRLHELLKGFLQNSSDFFLKGFYDFYILKMRSFDNLFEFREEKEFEEAILGEYGGWSNAVQLFLARQLRILKASCARGLS